MCRTQGIYFMCCAWAMYYLPHQAEHLYLLHLSGVCHAWGSLTSLGHMCFVVLGRAFIFARSFRFVMPGTHLGHLHHRYIG